MHTSTLILLLTGIIAVLVALVVFLVWRMARKDDELRLKNRVIVDEVERRHRVIDRAVSLGVNRAALLLSFSLLLVIAACTKEGDTIYQPDPADAASTAPLVTVIYDPNALGDGGYNDLIYQGVEQAIREHGLRTMQLSPATKAEGLTYLQTMFQQMEAAQDTVRRLFIVAAASYDDYLRQNNSRLEKNAYADLLYLETKIPLSGKGSTLYLPFYGAMYEAGAVAPVIAPEVLLVAANPKVETVKEAVEAFTEGFRTGYLAADDQQLVTQYLSDDVAGGFAVADTTAMRLLYQQQWQAWSQLMVPVCGGAGSTFHRLIEMLGGYEYVGIDATVTSPYCPFSAVKHIDRAVSLCIGQWLSVEGMPKHQVLGLADGYTELVVHPYTSSHKQAFSEQLTEALLLKIHNDAIRKEAEHEK
jgi:basic membrane protein A